MEQSLYLDLLKVNFPQLVTAIAEKLNERRQSTLTYLYRDLLTPRYTADGRWASITANYNRVAADIVALDSELPLKSRDTIETVTGEIPKLGLKLYLSEKQMKDIDAMIAQNLPLASIVDRVFEDTPRVIEAIYERLEDMFLSGLSSGVALSANSTGTGVRIDYGFPTANKFGVSSAWAANPTTATAIDDIEKVFDKAQADGNVITDVWADDVALKAYYANKQVREQYAFNAGISITGGAIPVLNLEQAASVFLTRWGVTLHRVNRSIKTEINGAKNNHKPWQEGAMTFTCDERLGSLVWTTVAESKRPVPGVQYATVDEFILTSKYSKTDPLREFTASQAMVLPVLDNVDRIYSLDTKTVQA